jgi:GT2 family glycosyltransferase
VASTNPSLSIIIPTRGRDGCVRQTLRDLAAQDYPDFDIWLVDQNDSPLSALERDAGKAPLHHEKMPPLGSHAGRNHAIARARGELCIFVDDDVRVPAGFLAAHARAYAALPPEVGAVAGRVVQPRDGYSDETMREMGRAARYNRWLGRVSGNFVGSEPAFVEHIHECNFSARTEALRRIGGFNEEFRGNAYFEGADLALRLIEAGYRIAYRPEISLTHLQEGAGGNRVTDKAAHTYWFMRNYGLLNSLHMKTWGLPLYSAYGLGYVFAKAVKNRSTEIAVHGARGLLEGLGYFLPGAERLRTKRFS